MSYNSTINQIFFDKRKRRWKYFILLILLFTLFLTLFFASAVTSVVFKPDLPDLQLSPLTEKNSEAMNFQAASQSSGQHSSLETNVASAQSPSSSASDKPMVIAFHVNWDDMSSLSLERNAD